MQQITIAGTFTVPAISFSDPKDWFVYFRFSHQGKDYLRKYREDLNRVKDKGQRMVQAQQLRQEREDWLKIGWNPIVDPEFKVRHIKPTQASPHSNGFGHPKHLWVSNP